MRALIVLAHEVHQSFNCALKDATVTALEDAGYTVDVSDLYAMKWDPVASARTDIVDAKTEIPEDQYFKYQLEASKAYSRGSISNDIKAEQLKLELADLVVFQFPLWWFGMPAIMKGWIDRVFTNGFAYGSVGWFSKGPFKDKKAVVSLTTGGGAWAFETDGLYGDMEVILWPIHNGIFRFTGFKVLSPNVIHAPVRMSDDERATVLQDWKARLAKIQEETPLLFHDLESFDNFRLKEGAASFTTVGQHMNKPLPVGQMGYRKPSNE